MSTSDLFKPSRRSGLAETLVEAALGLLEEEGEAGLSLRGAARRAGVSSMAPYRHFQNKADLLDAVAARGFDALTERLAAADAGGEGHAALAAQGAAYVAFACAHPALFRLMFVTAQPREGTPLGAAAQGAYAVLTERAGSLAGAMSREDLTLSAWALVHGLATLIIDRRMKLEPGQVEALAQRLTLQFATLVSGGAAP